MAEDEVAAVDDGHLAGEFVEDAGEFVGDIAAAGDHRALRHLVQVEHLVRGDAVLGAGHVGDDRMGAGGDEDGRGAQFGAVGQSDLVGSGDGRPLGEDLDVVAVEDVGVDAFEPLDLGQHIVAQGRPVEGAALDLPAEPGGVLQILGEMGAVDEQFLGHAAADHAGAADLIFLGDGDARAVRGRHAGRAHAARSGADDEEVIVVGCGH